MENDFYRNGNKYNIFLIESTFGFSNGNNTIEIGKKEKNMDI